DQQRLAQAATEVEGADQLPALDLRALRRVLLARWREALVRNVLFGVMEGVAGDRAREAHREVQLAAGRPAAGFAEAGDGAVGAHADTRPLHLAGVVVHRGAQVDQHVRRLVLLEGVAVHAHARA